MTDWEVFEAEDGEKSIREQRAMTDAEIRDRLRDLRRRLHPPGANLSPDAYWKIEFIRRATYREPTPLTDLERRVALSILEEQDGRSIHAGDENPGRP